MIIMFLMFAIPMSIIVIGAMTGIPTSTVVLWGINSMIVACALLMMCVCAGCVSFCCAHIFSI